MGLGELSSSRTITAWTAVTGKLTGSQRLNKKKPRWAASFCPFSLVSVRIAFSRRQDAPRSGPPSRRPVCSNFALGYEAAFQYAW